MHTATATYTLDEILGLARAYATARDRLAETAGEIREMQRKVIQSRIRGLQSRIADAAAAREELHDAIDGSRALFGRPRTRAVDGVKFGIRKGVGSVRTEDPERCMTLIAAHLPERAEELIRTSRRINLTALKGLDVCDLRRIGAEVTQTADSVTISSARDALDQLIETLLDAAKEDMS